MKILFSIISLIILYAQIVFANIINIPDDYQTIQAGIDAASNGDTILVANGVYYESIDYDGRDVFLSSMYLYSSNRDDIDFTIIRTDFEDRVITFDSGESSDAVVNGFTIMQGKAIYGGGIICENSNPIITNCAFIDNYSEGFGGAIFCENCSPIIRNNIFLDNYAEDNGGAIYCLRSDPDIYGNTFTENSTARNAGAIYCWYSNPEIEFNRMIQNSAGDRGGAIYLWGSNPRIIDNQIELNDAQRYGGAMYIYASNPIIYGNIVSKNSSLERGGGIFFWHSMPIIKNNIVCQNSSAIAGGIYCADNSDAEIINNSVISNLGVDMAGGFYCRDSGPQLINNIFWHNESPDGAEIYLTSSANPIISYCNVEGGWEGIGNIDSDPLFRDTLSGDYHLMAIDCGDTHDSPGIDSGDPDLADDSLDCDYGLGTIRSDLGCYGGGMITVGINDHERSGNALPLRTELLNSYPNPFNATTVLRFVNQSAGDINLSIYDILGRKITTLYDGYAAEGELQISWSAREQATGVYFARLTTVSGTSSRRLILLK